MTLPGDDDGELKEKLDALDSKLEALIAKVTGIEDGSAGL